MVYGLIHRLLCTKVVGRFVRPAEKAKTLTHWIMVGVCVFVPVVPVVMLIMGTSVGVVSILTLGAINPSSKGQLIRKE
jgi:hypothetical protein